MLFHTPLFSSAPVHFEARYHNHHHPQLSSGIHLENPLGRSVHHQKLPPPASEHSILVAGSNCTLYSSCRERAHHHPKNSTKTQTQKSLVCVSVVISSVIITTIWSAFLTASESTSITICVYVCIHPSVVAKLLQHSLTLSCKPSQATDHIFIASVCLLSSSSPS